MSQQTLIVFIFLATVLTGCATGDEDYVDFGHREDTGTTIRVDTTPRFAQYFYARVSATESAMNGEDPGPDIDAVILNQGGANIEATSVELLTDMSAYTNYKPRDVNTAGTRIDAFDETDPTKLNAESACDTSPDSFVSIGGTDAGEAAAIWTFPIGIRNTDTIYVIEVGDCDALGSTAGSEPYSVEVSISTTVDANWQSLGERTTDAPVAPFSVESLPFIPLGN